MAAADLIELRTISAAGRVASAAQPEAARRKSEARIHMLVRVAVVLAAVIAAYNFSLLTLLRVLSSASPLAYLGLVPFISVLLALYRVAVRRPEPNIHDRHLDYIVGVPLLVTAIVMLLVLPVRLSTFFWLWRVDLLSLPLFVAGITSIVFGTRVLWRLKIPIAFLLLAWPVPYEFGLNNWLERFSGLAVAALGHIAAVLHVARPAASTDGSLFLVTHAGRVFTVVVPSAFSGATGLVGYLLIATTLLAIVRGNWLRKLTWLTLGLALIWALNLLRLVLIFAAGSLWGESFASIGLHPVFGLVTLSVGVLAVLLMMAPFRLRTAIPWRQLRGMAPASGWKLWGATNPAVKRVGLALMLVVVAAMIAAPADASMQRFELLAHDLGPSRLAFTTDANAGIDGWLVLPTTSYDWANVYFGPGATWTRYLYARNPSPGRTAADGSPAPVTMDVIRTQDLNTLSQHGIEASYRFRNYRMLADQQVDLGGGLTGHAVSYRLPELHETWSAVYWEWPVDNGTGPTYERVVLNQVNPDHANQVASTNSLAPAPPVGTAVDNTAVSFHSSAAASKSLDTLASLVGFSRQVLSSVASHSTVAAAGSGQ